MPLSKRAGRLLVSLLLLNTLLVLTHLGEFWPQERHHELGEFWPFSIYPMFSRGGHPWVRSLVREVPDDSISWHPGSFDDLPGTAYALNDVGINQNDIANFISKSKTWDATRVAGFRSVFEGDLADKYLLILRADGSISGDSVSVTFTPFLLLGPDSTYFNPHLDYPGRP